MHLLGNSLRQPGDLEMASDPWLCVARLSPDRAFVGGKLRLRSGLRVRHHPDGRFRAEAGRPLSMRCSWRTAVDGGKRTAIAVVSVVPQEKKSPRVAGSRCPRSIHEACLTVVVGHDRLEKLHDGRGSEHGREVGYLCAPGSLLGPVGSRSRTEWVRA